jgi:hypothetical protein
MKDARKRVALVTCEAFANLYEDEHLLVAALADIGIASVPAVWSDASIDWTSFDALIMRTPWDYFERVAEFRAWLDVRIAERVLMCNSREILDWNFAKGYLQDLARAGVALVPTICIAQNDKADIATLARARGWNEIVVKPTIAGGACCRGFCVSGEPSRCCGTPVSHSLRSAQSRTGKAPRRCAARGPRLRRRRSLPLWLSRNGMGRLNFGRKLWTEAQKSSFVRKTHFWRSNSRGAKIPS